MHNYKNGDSVTVKKTGQEGTVIAHVKDVSKFLVRLDSGIAILLHASDIKLKQ